MTEIGKTLKFEEKKKEVKLEMLDVKNIYLSKYRFYVNRPFS